MNVRTFILLLIGLTLLNSGLAGAAPGNVRFTKHNMSNNVDPAKGLAIGGGPNQRRIYSNEVDQVCIFCHTPHNAQPAQPLWNKAMPTQTFRLYTSSPSLSAAAKTSSLPAGSVSLLCLACHDGKTAINVLHNSAGAGIDTGSDKKVDIGGQYDNAEGGYPNPAGGGVSLGIYGGFGDYPPDIGRTATDAFAGDNLTDDHPIGFSYTAAKGAATKLNDLATVSAKSSGAIRFYPPGNRVECSSCHDPHVNYTPGTPGANVELRPFLVMSNTGSAMCLSCHNK